MGILRTIWGLLERLFRPIAWLLTLLAGTLVIVVGFSTFLGLLIGNVPYAIPDAIFGVAIPVVGGASGTLATDGLAVIFVRIAVVTMALTVLIGIFNLLGANSVRIWRGNLSAKVNSAIVITSFIITLLFFLVRPTIGGEDGFLFLLENVQVPIESALAGLVFFALVYGAFRYLQDNVTPAGLVFVITVEIILIGALPLPGIAPLTQVTDWLMRVPVTAGARGILLGIALATVVTGLRVLIGQDRTYGE